MGIYVAFAGLVVLLFLMHREIAEAIDNFRNNFPRGGPPTPRHPLPSGDRALLRRRPRVIWKP